MGKVTRRDSLGQHNQKKKLLSFNGGEMLKHQRPRLREPIFFIFLIIVFSHCAQKIFLRQLPIFSPERINSIAILVDFTFSSEGAINIDKSKAQGDKIAREISGQLTDKKYAVARRQLTSVGMYLEDQTQVFEGGGKKSLKEPPIFIEKEASQDSKLKNALISSFKEIDKVISPYKGKKIEEKFLYSADVFMGENSRFLGQYFDADTLLFLYGWEAKQSDMSKLAFSIGYAAGMGLQGVLQAELFKTEYYEPDPLTYFGIYAAVGFVAGLTLMPDSYIACCGVIVDADSGKATWYNFTHWDTGGISGNQIGRLAKDLLKEFPEKR